MKSLIKYIDEALFSSASEFSKADTYEYFPKNHYELVKLVNDLIYDKKIEELNKINVSDIIDFSSVFSGFINNFNCGIIDLTNWDVSNAETMERMFYNCSLNFNISNWNVSSVTDMKEMFSTSAFNGDISKWDVSSVKNMTEMFAYSKFNGDISEWDVSNVTDMKSIFYRTPLFKNPPKWYKK